jgi:hypothetical protein
MISTEIMTKFAEARLGFSKIQDVININTSLMHRIVLPGDFPNSASNYAQYPGIITFAKEITGPDEIAPRYIYVDPEHSRYTRTRFYNQNYLHSHMARKQGRNSNQ